MRTSFAQTSTELLGERERPMPEESKGKAAFVQLEIPIVALQRLIGENSLLVEELHCLNKKSQKIIRRALLDSLVT